jgi:hypothetical protein
MTTWLDTAIEKALNPIKVNVAHIDLPVDEIEVLPLSAAEFQKLKALPELTKIKNLSDRQEVFGLRVIYEMMSKCDESLNWTKFNSLPINLLAALATAVNETVGTAQGGGAMGNS